MASEYKEPEIVRVVDASDQLDWVTERVRCSARTVFNALMVRAKADVKTRNDLLTEDETNRRLRFAFSIDHDHPDYFLVSSHQMIGPNENHRDVRFFRRNETIEVSGGGGFDIMATVILTNTGDCRLKVKEAADAAVLLNVQPAAELTQWQFLRLVLEDLFFPGPERVKP
jgi:hypothetical protein